MSDLCNLIFATNMRSHVNNVILLFEVINAILVRLLVEEMVQGPQIWPFVGQLLNIVREINTVRRLLVNVYVSLFHFHLLLVQRHKP